MDENIQIFQLTDELRTAEKALEAFRAAATALRDARAMPESNDFHASRRRAEAIDAACEALEALIE